MPYKILISGYLLGIYPLLKGLQQVGLNSYPPYKASSFPYGINEECNENPTKIVCKFQSDFQGPAIMGPLYGKLPILFPYHSHKNP